MPSQIITETSNNTVFDIIFVMVKCHNLVQSTEKIRDTSTAQSSVVFMQNGVGSFDLIKPQLQDLQSYLGITSFNVLQQAQAHFHKGSEGGFVLQNFANSEFIQQALAPQCKLVDGDFQAQNFGNRY